MRARALGVFPVNLRSEGRIVHGITVRAVVESILRLWLQYDMQYDFSYSLHSDASIVLRKTLVANSRQQRARMHENLNISGTSNHRGWWVVSALLALPQLCRTAPKSSGWVGAV